jgi:hypothetical protein
MAVKERTGAGKDAAFLRSEREWHRKNDQYDGRTTDEDLAYCDGYPLAEREEWDMKKVARRAKWEANGDD